MPGPGPAGTTTCPPSSKLTFFIPNSQASSGTEAMTKRESRIMHAYLWQTSPVSRSFPGLIPDAGQSLATVCEDNPRVLALLPFNKPSSDTIENHYSFLPFFATESGITDTGLSISGIASKPLPKHLHQWHSISGNATIQCLTAHNGITQYSRIRLIEFRRAVSLCRVRKSVPHFARVCRRKHRNGGCGSW